MPTFDTFEGRHWDDAHAPMDSSRWSLKGRTGDVPVGRAAHCVLREKLGDSDLNDRIPVLTADWSDP